MQIIEAESTLNLREQNQLAELEQVIERGLKTFVEVGTALLVIRDSRLYRQDYSTFEDYCRDRWGWERRHAYRLIDAAQVVENVSNWTQSAPATESQARPLARLEPEQQREVWQKAVETAPNGKVTAAHVQRVAKPHVSHNSGNNEWYTPPEFIEAARAVMGGIDLDPASSDRANEIVQAAAYYTAEDDGLSQTWRGRVWLNPPYATDLISGFANKLAAHCTFGEVEQAIVLVNNATETAWFRRLVEISSAVVFPEKRIRFWQPDGVLGAPLQGQAILYAGDNIDLFLAQFGRFGWRARL